MNEAFCGRLEKMYMSKRFLESDDSFALWGLCKISLLLWTHRFFATVDRNTELQTKRAQRLQMCYRYRYTNNDTKWGKGVN